MSRVIHSGSLTGALVGYGILPLMALTCAVSVLVYQFSKSKAAPTVVVQPGAPRDFHENCSETAVLPEAGQVYTCVPGRRMVIDRGVETDATGPVFLCVCPAPWEINLAADSWVDAG